VKRILNKGLAMTEHGTHLYTDALPIGAIGADHIEGNNYYYTTGYPASVTICLMAAIIISNAMKEL
jgi:hypothetical protein